MTENTPQKTLAEQAAQSIKRRVRKTRDNFGEAFDKFCKERGITNVTEKAVFWADVQFAASGSKRNKADAAS